MVAMMPVALHISCLHCQAICKYVGTSAKLHGPLMALPLLLAAWNCSSMRFCVVLMHSLQVIRIGCSDFAVYRWHCRCCWQLGTAAQPCPPCTPAWPTRWQMSASPAPSLTTGSRVALPGRACQHLVCSACCARACWS